MDGMDSNLLTTQGRTGRAWGLGLSPSQPQEPKTNEDNHCLQKGTPAGGPLESLGGSRPVTLLLETQGHVKNKTQVERNVLAWTGAWNKQWVSKKTGETKRSQVFSEYTSPMPVRQLCSGDVR